MAKKLRIVNAKGQLMSIQGKELVFDPDSEPQVLGMTERERAESVCFFANRSCDGGPFHVEEVEE